MATELKGFLSEQTEHSIVSKAILKDTSTFHIQISMGGNTTIPLSNLSLLSEQPDFNLNKEEVARSGSIRLTDGDNFYEVFGIEKRQQAMIRLATYTARNEWQNINSTSN